MKKAATAFHSRAIVFWLTLLTFALVVAFVMLYRVMDNVNSQNSLLKSSFKLTSPTYKFSTIDSTSITSPGI